MSRILDILRFTIISPEFLVLVVLILLVLLVPSLFIELGERFKSDNGLLNYLPTIPIALLAVSVRLGWGMCFPPKTPDNVLLKWKEYGRLKDRVVGSWFWCFGCALAAVVLWILKNDVSADLLGAIFVASIAISLVVVSTQIFAAFTMRELIGRINH